MADARRCRPTRVLTESLRGSNPCRMAARYLGKLSGANARNLIRIMTECRRRQWPGSRGRSTIRATLHEAVPLSWPLRACRPTSQALNLDL